MGQSSEDMYTVSVFAQSLYDRLHKRMNFWPIEEARSDKFLSLKIVYIRWCARKAEQSTRGTQSDYVEGSELVA